MSAAAIGAIAAGVDMLIELNGSTQRELARHITGALEAAGYAIVPVEPTAEMWAAVNLVERDAAGRGRINNLVSAEGWRAMLAAARLAE